MSIAPITQTSMMNINVIDNQINYKKQKIKSYALRISALTSFLGSVLATYLVNYKKNHKLADDYYLYITPSPGFFKIWPVIYSFLLIVVLHNLKNNIWKTKSSLIYIISNTLLIIQSIVFAQRTVPRIVVGGLILAAVDNTSIYFWRVLLDQYKQSMENQNGQVQQNISLNQINNRSQIINREQKIQRRKYSSVQLFLVRNAVSLYIGWVTVTGTVVTGIAVVYALGFSKCLQFIIFWITTPLAALGLYAFLAFKQSTQPKYCYGYVFGIIYGLIGAGIASINKIAQAGTC